MDKDYVQQYAKLEREHWWFLVRKKILLQFLEKNLPASSSLSILNVGAAAGASSQWLSSLGKVVSVENDPAFLRQLRQQRFEVTDASVTSLPFAANSFDLVCAFDVIEHVENDELALQELTRVCKTGGHICVAVPAMPGLWSQHDTVNGHYRRYTLESLGGRVSKINGLTLIDSRYFNSLLYFPIWATRRFGAIFRKKNSVSDFEFFRTPSWVSRLLQWIFGLEHGIFRNKRFSRGVSLAALFKKI